MKYCKDRATRETGKRGFSMLEVIITMSLFLLIVFSVGTLIPYSQMRLQSTSRRDVAITLAESMLEKIKSLPWDRVDLTREYDGSAASPTAAMDEGLPTRYPPLPYPQKTTKSLYPDSTTRQVLSRETLYFFYARAEPDKDSSGVPLENLAIVVVKVRWEEAAVGQARSREVVLKTKMCKR